MASSVRICDHCGVTGTTLSSCGRCKSAYYCNRSCQSEDWKIGGHKLRCIRTEEAPRASPATQPRAEQASSEEATPAVRDATSRGKIGDTNFARLPTIDIDYIHGNVAGARELRVPPPPCTMVLTKNGCKLGWLLILDVPIPLARQLDSVFEAVFKGGTASIFQGRGEAYRLLSILPASGREILLLMMGMQEYARRFVLKDVPPGDLQKFRFSRVEHRSDGSWVIPLSAEARVFNGKYGQIPCSMPGGNHKHCKSQGGLCTRGCVVAGCKSSGACADTSSASIWCHKCDMVRYCSVACKKEDRDGHREICKQTQQMRRTIGFSRVCHQCGVPDSDDGTQLRLCGKCKQALYCSDECASASWTSGHKLECLAMGSP